MQLDVSEFVYKNILLFCLFFLALACFCFWFARFCAGFAFLVHLFVGRVVELHTPLIAAAVLGHINYAEIYLFAVQIGAIDFHH